MGLIKETQEVLKRWGAPFVAVDEAKKALFQGAKLSSFHFVVYAQTGPNWLVCCGERTTANQRLMREWTGIFGAGFVAVFARHRKGGIHFCNIDGTHADLPTPPAALEPTPAPKPAPAPRRTTPAAQAAPREHWRELWKRVEAKALPRPEPAAVVPTPEPTRTAQVFMNVQETRAAQLSLF